MVYIKLKHVFQTINKKPTPETDAGKTKTWLESVKTWKTPVDKWLESFQKQFCPPGTPQPYPEPVQKALEKVQKVQDLHTQIVIPAITVYEVYAAREARKADGSCLEYGLDYHMRLFNNAVAKGVPSNAAQAKTALADMEKSAKTLQEWLDGFKAKFQNSSVPAAKVN